MTGSQPLLRMHGITKRFPGTLACDGAELTVLPGEVHCLLGENGAGKSTLVKLLAGMYRQDRGEIALAGRPLPDQSPRDRLAAGVSTIYQELDLVPDLTVAENMFLGHAPARGFVLRKRSRKAAAASMLARLGADFPPDARLRELPIAARQLTAIARALTFDARVIVMDEPTATLNDDEVTRVFELVRTLTAEGRSVIFITHRLDEVKAIGDRATVMRDGRTVGTFDVALTSVDELVDAMVGDFSDLVRRSGQSGRPAPGGNGPLLDIRRVTIPGVLDIRDLQVVAGEVTGLAGLGGAGRTTFLSALFGAVPADVQATIDGSALKLHGPRSAVRAGLALVPEDRKSQGLFLNLGVSRNAAIAALRARGVAPRARGQRMTRQILSDLGVKHASADQPAGELSGGNQQKVVLAKWVMRGVRVLLLDEPTRGLDIAAKADLYRQVRRLADDGAAVLLASSELTELTAHSDTIWVLYEGRNVARFDPRTINEDAIARSLITGSSKNA